MKATFLLGFLFAICSVTAQTNAPAIVNIAGGSYENAGQYVQYDWSIGELVLVDTYTRNDNSFTLTNGLLQPCTDKITGDPNASVFGPTEISIFPTLTAGPFEINFFLRGTGLMEIELVNASGQTLERRSYPNACCRRLERMNLSRYANGTYFLKILFTPEYIDRTGPPPKRREGGFKVVKIG